MYPYRKHIRKSREKGHKKMINLSKTEIFYCYDGVILYSRKNPTARSWAERGQLRGTPGTFRGADPTASSSDGCLPVFLDNAVVNLLRLVIFYLILFHEENYQSHGGDC